MRRLGIVCNLCIEKSPPVSGLRRLKEFVEVLKEENTTLPRKMMLSERSEFIILRGVFSRILFFYSTSEIPDLSINRTPEGIFKIHNCSGSYSARFIPHPSSHCSRLSHRNNRSCHRNNQSCHHNSPTHHCSPNHLSYPNCHPNCHLSLHSVHLMR